MQAAVAPLESSRRSDTELHCIAAGSIALQCSRTEAWLASLGKELVDLFGKGDAELRDLRADRRGIRCARAASGLDAIAECCRLSETPSDQDD
jgi:hypothetical protein